MNLNQLGLVAVGLFVGSIATASYFVTSSDDSTNENTQEAVSEVQEVPLQGRTFEVVELHTVEDDDGSLQQELDELKAELESLKLENDELRIGSMGLAEEADHSNKKFDAVVQQLAEFKHENIRLKQELGKFAESEITDEQMLSILDEPFSHFLLGFKGQQRDEVYDFFQQPEDHGWGYDMELAITDFFTNHELANELELVGVTCKIDRCEFRTIEPQPELGHFHRLWQELRSMPWWEFKSSHSSSSNTEDGKGQKIFIYVIK